ncbi:PEP-CTERM sorting domain-containing protein [Erythrobacter litoralis]|uniref:PEPxxWA-CTERM sorting domain-containing protein n=1 Tax=Erythrobacter litoralis TaxID=39960 RepID=UPI0024353B29|nr:PEPxxWA-CTERM sorting domain-containing protein [Erythrobacter litoralis]MDG6080146.1 PEP-CTERM sorting domain-containing protein [Erythrobacter litoralis]
MKNLLPMAAGAVALVAANPASAATEVLVGSGSGMVTSTSTDTTATLDYSARGFDGTWTLAGVSDVTGSYTFDFTSEGFYSFFAVTAAASAFSGETVFSLYDAGPANCCASPSNGFLYTGSVMLDLVAGQEFGFRLSGANFDSAQTLRGTFSVVQATGAVPEPATWALFILGFGVIGAAMRSAARKNVSVKFA